jgi:hypothetical protein
MLHNEINGTKLGHNKWLHNFGIFPLVSKDCRLWPEFVSLIPLKRRLCSYYFKNACIAKGAFPAFHFCNKFAEKLTRKVTSRRALLSCWILHFDFCIACCMLHFSHSESEVCSKPIWFTSNSPLRLSTLCISLSASWLPKWNGSTKCTINGNYWFQIWLCTLGVFLRILKHHRYCTRQFFRARETQRLMSRIKLYILTLKQNNGRILNDGEGPMVGKGLKVLGI